MDLGRQASGIGALADETRRALYTYVVAQPAPVSREQAAGALDLAPSTANFHLDKLVAERLLEVEYRRLSGKTGPGAGRPSKLYRRADQQFAVSLPERRYDLVGQILAAAVTSAGAGAPLDDALDSSARDEGLALGASAAEAGADADLAGRRPGRPGLRAAGRGGRRGAGELPLRLPRPDPHRAGLRTQPRVRPGGCRRARLRRCARLPRAGSGHLLRDGPAGLSSPGTIRLVRGSCGWRTFSAGARRGTVVLVSSRRWSVGSAPDLDELYDASYRRLVIQLYAICGDLADAEDAVQEAFVTALRKRREFTRVDKPEAWLRTVAVNRLRHDWRHAAVVRKYQARVPGPQRAVEVGPEHVAIVTALGELEPDQRQMVVLHHLADLGTADIAAELGIPEGTVKSRLSRARTRLAGMLDEGEEQRHV